MGLVIEKTKSFPCVIVKKTFHVTCGVASFQIQKMKLILFCRVPAKISQQLISGRQEQFTAKYTILKSIQGSSCFEQKITKYTKFINLASVVR